MTVASSGKNKVVINCIRNGNVKISNKDFHENYLISTLKNTNMYHLCLNFLNLEPFEIYKRIQKHIMNIQFLEDVEMTYALEN